MDLKARAKQLKIDIPAVFIAMRQRETPWYAKALAGLTVAYALSPIDLIPDFIPLLGYLDDVLLLPALVAITLKSIPPTVMDACRAQAKDLWNEGIPKRWYYALPIALIWLLLLWLLLKMIWGD